MSKQEIRKQIKDTLAALSRESRDSLAAESEKICKMILAGSDYSECTTLLAYMPLEDEVDIKPVIEAALKNGKEVFLPRIVPGTNQMDFYRYTAATNTAPGSFGITEPEPDEEQNFFRFLNKASTSQKILMLVPGRAFTKDGRRLGRGKGFYDIYFSRLAATGFSKGIKKSGVCFACQLLADLPTTPDDVLMDTVVSTSSTTAHTISVK